MSVRAAYRMCSTVSGLEQEFQRPPENCFSSIYAGIPKEQDLVPGKEGLPQQQDRWTCQGEWRQAGKKQKLPSSTSFQVGNNQRCGQDLGWTFLLQMMHK